MARVTVTTSLLIMGLSLILMSLLLTRGSAADLETVAAPSPVLFRGALTEVSTPAVQAALGALLDEAPDAFLPGTRVVPTRQMLPATLVGAGDWTLVIEGYPTEAVMDLSDLRARLEASDGTLKPINLGTFFELEAPGIIAGHDLARDTTLAAEDLAIAYLSLHGKQPGQVITDPLLVLGTALKADLRQGRPVELRLLTLPTLVTQGSTVTVRCVVGDLTIESSARALESGSKGERITCINIETGARIEGEILSTGLVLVTP